MAEPDLPGHIRGMSHFPAIALMFLIFVAHDNENPESTPGEKKTSRPRLVVVTAFWAIIADKIYSAFRRRRKRIRQAEKEELERYRDE